MLYRLLADGVLVLHLLLIIFGLLGGLLYFWRKWILVLHVPLAVWISLIEFFGWVCPLTPLENSLRMAGGEAGYDGGFIEHYLSPLIYPAGLTRDLQLLLGVIATGTNLMVYSLIVRHWCAIRRAVRPLD